MDGLAEPSQVIANGLPALEVREAWQKSLKLNMPRFFQCAIRLSGCLFLAIRLSAILPNILIIQTDEHHFQTLACYGGQIVQTPHIDRLASEGAPLLYRLLRHDSGVFVLSGRLADRSLSSTQSGGSK